MDELAMVGTPRHERMFPPDADASGGRDGRNQRGTQESNLALRFWRPPC